jgi:hypothetical protein
MLSQKHSRKHFPSISPPVQDPTVPLRFINVLDSLMIQEKRMPQLSSVSLATSRRHVLMDFAFSHIVRTSQPHSIFGVTLTSLDFGAKKIHKIHRAFDPDPGF